MDNLVVTKPHDGIVKELITSSKVSNIPLTQEELDNMKKKKPSEYVKVMMSAWESYTKKGSSSSTASGSRSTVEPADRLLQPIREQAFDVNLIQGLERNISAIYGIKDLLKRVDILSISLEAADFVVKLGFLIDQDFANLLRKQDSSTKIEKKMET